MTEILILAAEGLPSRRIAERLFIGKRTVDFHWQRIFAALGVRRQLDAVLLAKERGLI